MVVLHGFGKPPVDLFDAGRLGRVGGEEFWGFAAALGGLGHADPKVARGVRVVSGLGHVNEPQVVSLGLLRAPPGKEDRKSTRLNSSHSQISYAVFCLR